LTIFIIRFILSAAPTVLFPVLSFWNSWILVNSR